LAEHAPAEPSGPPDIGARQNTLDPLVYGTTVIGQALTNVRRWRLGESAPRCRILSGGPAPAAMSKCVG